MSHCVILFVSPFHSLNNYFLAAGDEPEINREEIMKTNLSRMAIRRLARRGGVKRISAKVYAECREVLAIFIDKVCLRMVRYVLSTVDRVGYQRYFQRTYVSLSLTSNLEGLCSREFWTSHGTYN